LRPDIFHRPQIGAIGQNNWGEIVTQTSRLLCAFYAVVALVALYGTWSQNLAYFGPGAAGGASFLADLRVNPASRSISIDIGFFLLAAGAFMVFEARRIGQRFVWIYIAFGFAIAISVTFPLFLLGRELRTASQAPVSPPSQLTRALDLVGLAGLSALSIYFMMWIR